MKHDPHTFKIAFAVTETGPEAAAGDYFTALELGTSLRKLLRWQVVWLPKKDWYNVGDANAVIAMTDHYDLTQLGPSAANLIKICWMRNWFDRWAGKPFFPMWDICLSSSEKAADFISKKYGITPSVLRIGTNSNRFRPRNTPKLYDYTFTGSYWGAPRDIENIDPQKIGLRFALFGKNWEKHQQFSAHYKGFLPYHAMSKVYNQSRLLVDDANTATKQWGSMNSRVFDALAAGTLVVTNNILGSAEVFDGNLPTYDSPESLQNILNRYLDNPDLYNSTLEALRADVLANHTYDTRARELAKTIHIHLQARQQNSESATPVAEQITTSRPAPHGQPFVSIIIPVFNQVYFTAACLKALFENTPNTAEVIVVDNGSTDSTSQLLAQYGNRIRVIRNAQNEGFARACNRGAAASKAPYLLFLNNDTEVQPGWLDPLIAMGSRPEVGAVGSRLLFSDGTVQHAGVTIVERRGKTSILPRHAFIGEAPKQVPPFKPTLMQAVTAACMLVNASYFYDANGFDTAYWNGCEDVDLCFKLAQLGKKIVYEPESIVVHHEGKSGHERTVAINTNNARLRGRWKGLIEPDLIETNDSLETAEGLDCRLREGGELAPDSEYGEALKNWWGRYRDRYLAPKSKQLGKARIALRICTPSRKSPAWEDTAFGQDLADSFNRMGHCADVQFKEEWYQGSHDITIHIRGVYRHYPQPGIKNILWIIGHPELITKDELNSYDLVFCASAQFLRQIAPTTATPCHYLPLAATSAFVRSKPSAAEELDLLFVGDNYAFKENRRRRIVQDILDAGYEASLRVLGRNWQDYLPQSMRLEEHIPQQMLPYFYGKARINLNDHHPAMARDGFVNNRTFDLGALGLFQISNVVPGIEELGVVTYMGATDLRHKVEYYLSNPKARQEIAAYSYECCRNETFDARAKTILEHSAG